MAKKHTPLLAMMIDSIPITLPSYLFGVQTLIVNQYSPMSIHVAQKYIKKYASKAKTKCESFHHMLRRIFLASLIVDPTTSAFRKFLAETLVDRDIGA